jgi:hypothetical protein
LLNKLRFLLKPGAFVPLILVILLLLFAAIFALTQETDDNFMADDFESAEYTFEFPDGELEPLPEWIPPGPPRWFRSNAGGMTLEEVSSRLAALRNTYALVIDYTSPAEMDERLKPFYRRDYTIEVRILYEKGEESRRQWLFQDAAGVTRLNAVFMLSPNEQTAEESLQEESLEEEEEITEETEVALADEDVPPDESVPDMDSPSVVSAADEGERTGFIELYNDKARIIEDRWLFDNGNETHIVYLYSRNMLIKAQTRKKFPDSPPVALYTDNYRYNRSFSLRHVERLYHAESITEPVRLTFPSRVLESASNQNFLSDKLYVQSDFLMNFVAGEGFRMVYDTDDRGRIITQTLINDQNETVWMIKNTWSGDRIVAILKTEGKDEKRIEFEYDRDGNRMVQRDLHNGVLERMVHVEGNLEIEELFINGVVVLRAHWEDGRKIFEERVRRQ